MAAVGHARRRFPPSATPSGLGVLPGVLEGKRYELSPSSPRVVSDLPATCLLAAGPLPPLPEPLRISQHWAHLAWTMAVSHMRPQPGSKRSARAVGYACPGRPAPPLWHPALPPPRARFVRDRAAGCLHRYTTTSASALASQGNGGAGRWLAGAGASTARPPSLRRAFRILADPRQGQGPIGSGGLPAGLARALRTRCTTCSYARIPSGCGRPEIVADVVGGELGDAVSLHQAMRANLCLARLSCHMGSCTKFSMWLARRLANRRWTWSRVAPTRRG